MRRRDWIWSAGGWAWANLGLTHAETIEEKGKRIVDEALAAMGGEKFLAMQDRLEEGRAYSFYREQLSGLTRARIYTRYLVRPEPPVAGFFGVRERQAFGKDEYNSVLFNEEGKGWDITFRGARPLPPPLLERFRDSTLHNIFYILRMRLGEPGLILESRGREIIENMAVEVVDITDADNRVTKVYFHHLTKLPVKQMFVRRDPQTKNQTEEVTRFSKYRDVGGGVMWPFTIQRERDGEAIYSMFSEAVAVNKGLTDNNFTLPGDINELPPAK